MTVSTTSSTVTLLGNGSTTVWSFPFIGVVAGDLIVSVTNSAGVTTVLSGTQYSVNLNAVPVGSLWGIGGTVTYPLTDSALAAGNSLTITRNVPFTQTVSIANQGPFYPQAVEQALDLLELQIQQIETLYLYTMKFPITDGILPNTLPSAILRANGILGFDVSGQPVVTTVPSVTPTPGTFATPRRIGTTGTATINILTGDSFAGVSVYQSSTPVTTLQLPVGFGPYPVYDGGGNAGSSPITVLPPSGKLINGLSQYILAFNYQSAVFANDGLNILVT